MKYMTIDLAIDALLAAKKKIGGDKCLILCLEDSEIEDVTLEEGAFKLIDDENNQGQYIEVLVKNQYLLNALNGTDLFADAVGGLTEYHEILRDPGVVAVIRSKVNIPNTGNNQLDYENVRDQVEKLAAEYPQPQM